MVMDFQSCLIRPPQKIHQSRTFFANPHDLMKKNVCKNVSVSVERRFPPTAILSTDFQLSCQQSAPLINRREQVIHSCCILPIIRVNSVYTAAQQQRNSYSTNILLVLLFIPGPSRSGGERGRAPGSRPFGL